MSFFSSQFMILQKIQMPGQKIIASKRGGKMPRTYHKCHFCGGRVTEKKVTFDYRWGEEFIAVLKNVPAGVCQVCGEQYYKAEIVKKMERLIKSKEKAKEFIHVPIRELQIT